MNWLVFSYSLPSKSQSSPRVTLWRRLHCIEAFQWLTQEVKQLNGEAVVMYVERFEGLDDRQLIELFRSARSEDYAEIDAQAEELENKLAAKTIDPRQQQDILTKLRKRYAEVVRIDFFDSPAATQIATRFTRIEQALHPRELLTEKSAICTISQYQDKRWVTRPRPFIDRLACIWLIRRFINPNAIVRYSLAPEPDEVTFDMKEAEFGHWGNLCSFETMLVKFGLKQPSLSHIGEIVHELDLRDGRYTHPQTEGVETILRGWLLMGLADVEIESRGLTLFDGLYATFSHEKKFSKTAL
jgi:hypothetical protein